VKGRSGEGVVAVVIALVLFGGVALDSWGPKVPGDVVEAADEAEFTARAVFCPPSLGKPASRVSLTVATGAEESVAVGVEPGSEQREDLEPGSILAHKPPTAGASDVVGYGGRVDATAVTSIDEPVAGVGAAACSRRASTRWYFPEGNSTVTHDQRMLIYNPFPDEAVVSISLLTPAGERSKAGLSDLAVPSESSIAVEINEFVFEDKILGTVVSAVRGRMVVWRLSMAEPERKPSGLQFTLGATVTNDVWHFPEGAVGEGLDERLTVMNPGPQEALIDVSLVTAERTEQVAALTGVSVPPRSTISIPLDESMVPGGEGGGAGAVIRSVNEVPVVAERTVFYATEDLDGVASEIGAPAPAERWLLGPATTRPETDSALLLNPGASDVEVTLELMRADGRTLRPRTLRNLPLRRGTRLRVPLSDITDGEPAAVMVTATGPVVAERFSYSSGAGDVASVMGLPLPD
jgi:hypothetical protein